ncbi:MAG: methyltransferase [Acidimicrobiales bacterium]
MGDAPGQYFSPEPTVASAPLQVSLHLPDLSLTLQTDRGVFAGGGVDPGTKILLLDGSAAPFAGDLLDLGCGYGPIALTLAVRSPAAHVWAVDVNERARSLCAANAAANGITNITVAAPDDVPAELRFAAVWSNPPIRVGKGALHELLKRWLDRLADGSCASLVVQKHLGADSLMRWLAEQGWPTTRVAARQGYRVLQVLPR